MLARGIARAAHLCRHRLFRLDVVANSTRSARCLTNGARNYLSCTWDFVSFVTDGETKCPCLPPLPPRVHSKVAESDDLGQSRSFRSDFSRYLVPEPDSLYDLESLRVVEQGFPSKSLL